MHKDSLSSHPGQHLLSLVFLIIAILTDVRCLIAVVICIFPTTADVEAVLPDSPCPSVMQDHFSILDGMRKKWAPLSVSHTAGETRCSHSVTVPYGRNCGLKESLLALNCTALEEG